MHKELDDILQHVGVRGMKWGVRKSSGDRGSKKPGIIGRKVATTKERSKADKEVHRKMRSKELSKKQGRAALLENVHKSNMSSKTYNRHYNRRVKIGQKHLTAVRGATADTKTTNALKMKVGTAIAVNATVAGSKLARSAYKTATTPENIRRGRNIVQAAMRSNIRFVDGSKMTNVI